MIKNIKFTLTSIISIVILIALAFIFTAGFLAILGIFFLTRIYKKIVSNKKDKNNNISSSEDKSDKVVEVDKDSRIFGLSTSVNWNPAIGNWFEAETSITNSDWASTTAEPISRTEKLPGSTTEAQSSLLGLDSPSS